MAKSIQPFRLTKRRIEGIRAVRAAADLVLSIGDYTPEEEQHLEAGIEWIDLMLAVRGKGRR